MPNPKKSGVSRLALAFLLLSSHFFSPAVQAVDYYFSGFGTVGYATSDIPNRYRYISNRGTFLQDSLIAGQLDLSFSPQWQATVQAKIAQTPSSDSRWKPDLTWAFISWQPTNDMLFRLGKLRIPALLYSENLDVQMTYDALRLPIEHYLSASTYDYLGASFTKTWEMPSNSHLTWDVYGGKTKSTLRAYFRDGIPPAIPSVLPIKAGPFFNDIHVVAFGTLLTLRQTDSFYRIGTHYGYTKNKDGSPIQVNPQKNAFGIYGGSNKDHLTYAFLTLGADIHLGNNFFIAGEFARRQVLNVTYGHDSSSFYLQLRKKIGRWTPYVGYAAIKPDQGAVNLYEELLATTNLPIANTINRAQADALLLAEQSSVVLGTSFYLNAESMIKAEYMRTRVGSNSALVDNIPGKEMPHKAFNVFSLSYNFIF